MIEAFIHCHPASIAMKEYMIHIKFMHSCVMQAGCYELEYLCIQFL
jgi:hypothetical protein